MKSRELESLFLAYRERGDATALAEVFDRSAPELYELARRLAPERSAAEDLLQDTFVTAIEKRAQWDSREPLMPWLIGILAIASQRGRRERARRPDPERVTHLHVERPDEALEALERRSELEATLAALGPDERALVEQRLLEGRSPRDMARERGLAATTLRMRLSRALSRLRRAAPSSSSWVLLPSWSRRRAVRSVRSRILPGVPGATPALAPVAFAASLLCVATVAGTIGVVACLAPQKVQPSAAAEHVPAPELAAGSQTAVRLEMTPTANGVQASAGAATSSERAPVPRPAPLFRISTAPEPGEIAARPDAPSVARKHVHLAIRRLGAPVPHARVLREFADGGYEGNCTDERGRLDLEFVELPEVQLCIQAPGCRTRRVEFVPARLADGGELAVDLEPGPEPVRVRLNSATGFPEGWCARFVPLALLGDRRPGLSELLFELPTIGHSPDCQLRSVKPDGTLESAVDPGRYWVVLHSCTGSGPASKPTLLESRFELTVPEVAEFECRIETLLGGVILVDVEGQAGAGKDVLISLVEGEKERLLVFEIARTGSSGSYSGAIPLGTAKARSETLPSGEQVLVIRQGSRELERRRVTIPRGGELELEIRP